jgi:hypothetical protein
LRFINFLRRIDRRLLILLVPLLLVLLFMFGWWLIRRTAYSPTREQLNAYASDPASRPPLITNLTQPCTGASFRLPSAGFVGFLYGDPTAPNTPLNRHTGIDIFGNGDPGTVPVYAAYDGYLTRLPDWISSVIIRIPQDPLDPSRQIWTYYTHMANLSGQISYISSEFPPGTHEKFVQQGTLLGYQGLYAGVGAAPILMHVHFSVVLSDSNGSFRNETHIENTLDPSPYLGLNVNASAHPVIPVHCGA